MLGLISYLLMCVVALFPSTRLPLPDQKSPPAGQAKISKKSRVEIERTFAVGLVYARVSFPSGLAGLTLKSGQITPADIARRQIIDSSGVAAKAGDLVKITAIIFKPDHIRFEINGGPAKNPKWYQKVTITGPGGAPLPTPSKDAHLPKDSAWSRGSYVDLYFDGYVPELTNAELREFLRPVFNFDAKSAVEAYMDTVSPKVKNAIENHAVLVGMNRQMVIFAKGLPIRKIRQTDNGTEHEEWVYGEPPQDVEFVRFNGDEVVRVEVMKISGEHTIRTQKETDTGGKSNQ